MKKKKITAHTTRREKQYTRCTYIQHSKRCCYVDLFSEKFEDVALSFIYWSFFARSMFSNIYTHYTHIFTDTCTRIHENPGESKRRMAREEGHNEMSAIYIYVFPYWSSASCVFTLVNHSFTRVLFTQFLYLTFSNLCSCFCVCFNLSSFHFSFPLFEICLISFMEHSMCICNI